MREGAEVIKSKGHLSKEGVEHIRTIQGRMNSRRYCDPIAAA